MSITMDDVRAQLDRYEPDYNEAARLGLESVPFLLDLVQGDDPLLASKAAYLASLIQGEQSFEILELAAHSPYDVVRVAAASGVRNLQPLQANQLLKVLLRDQDFGVRNVSLRSAEASLPEGAKGIVEEVAQNDSDMLLRQLASQILRKFP